MPNKLKRCPNGTRRNKKTGECITKTNTTRNNIVAKRRRCPNGMRRDKATGECIAKNPVTPPPKQPSPKLLITPGSAKPFKIKSKLRPVIDQLLKPNLDKVNKLDQHALSSGGLKHVEDYCGYQSFIMYKWLTNKYKKVINTDLYYIEIFLTKDAQKINYSKMSQCLNPLVLHSYCYTKGLLNYGEYCKDAISNGKLYYITPLILTYSGSKIGHRNALVHDLKKNQIYRFEPHGWDTTASSSAIDVYLKKKIHESLKKHGIDKMPEYLPIKTVMPRHGPQWFDFEKGGGRCVIWTQAFLHHRLQYNHLTLRQIFENMGLTEMKKTNAMSENEIYNLFDKKDKHIVRQVLKTMSFIRRYTHYLKSQKAVMNLYDTSAYQKFILKQLG